MSTEIRVVLADAVVVGPNDKLIVRIKDDIFTHELADGLMEEFKQMGLTDRVLVLWADDLEFAKVEGV